jgi:hypothetical protein
VRASSLQSSAVECNRWQSSTKRILLFTSCLLLFTSSSLAATPQEEAFMRVWRMHASDPTRHDAIIEACQSVMDRASTLGDYLPVVKTLAAWHLLASGKQQDAARIFETALVADSRAAPAIVRSADTMARRWLTRIDALAVEKALKAYYASNVEFPGSLSAVMSQPNPPPRTDRFSEAWVYAPSSFSKLANTKNQRFTLTSRTLGARLTALKQFPFTGYGKRQAVITARRPGNPVMVEFETVAESDAAPQRGTASEGSAVNGIRFLRLASEGQFALMVENENDFWVVATVRSR